MPVQEITIDRAYVAQLAGMPTLDGGTVLNEDDVRLLNQFFDYTENGRTNVEFVRNVLGLDTTDKDKINNAPQKVKLPVIKALNDIAAANNMTVSLSWPRFKKTGGGGRPSKQKTRVSNAMAQMLFHCVQP